MDLRTILDGMGADKLLGKGDMLYLPPGSAKLIRAHGALITDQEIQSIVDCIARQGKPSYEIDIHEQLSKPDHEFEEEEGIDEDEELIQQCIEVIRSEQKASVSLLQRRLGVGYARASRMIEMMAQAGILGEYKGSQAREVTMTAEDWQQIKANMIADEVAGALQDLESAAWQDAALRRRLWPVDGAPPAPEVAS